MLSPVCRARQLGETILVDRGPEGDVSREVFGRRARRDGGRQPARDPVDQTRRKILRR
jgi:hypothetical protein